jgi:type VI protein secretion system component VasK
MKSYLWTAVLAAVMGVLTQTQTVWAIDPEKEAADGNMKQEVWDAQVKYATYGGIVVACGVIVYWLLSKANQREKKTLLELKKRDRLDPNEGMPIN